MDQQLETLIAPSILAANPLKFAEEIKSIEDHADLIHFDVMDGHFVPNLTFGLPVISSLKKVCKLQQLYPTKQRSYLVNLLL